MDKVLLEYEMKKRGLNSATLCKQIGICRSAFSKKCNGKSEFKLSEIQAIVNCLELEDPAPIFFNQKVSNKTLTGEATA